MFELIGRLSVLLTARERRQAAALFGLMMVGAMLEMLGVGAIPAFVTLLSDPTGLDRLPAAQRLAVWLGADTPERLVIVGAVALFVLFAVKNLYLVALSWVQARYVYNRQVAVAQRLLWRYLRAPYTFHLQRNSAELLRASNQDAMEVVGSGLIPLLTLAMEALTVTAVLGLLLYFEPLTSAVAFTILGGSTAIFLRVLRRRTLRYGQQMHESRLGMLKAVNEGLGGIKVTRVLGRERDFFDAFAGASATYSRTGRMRQVLMEVPRLFLETAGIGGLLGVAVLLSWQGRPATALVPTLALLAVAVVRMIPSFNRITNALNSIRYGRAAIDAVYHDLTVEMPGETPQAEAIPLRDAIRLDGVTFTYPGSDTPSLSGVTLTVRRGESVGFVGPTGSGKTTLVDLVLGLLAPDEGRVTVDGVDIRGRERAWQRNVGYVPQDVYLTDDSIRRNVAFGIAEADIDDAAVWRAVDAAQAREFVDRLPEGLATLVGERGVRLSGGQRQRLGIARALYHDPAVLVLDEATSALDHETEAAVMDAVEHLRGERTILMIAHRLTTVEACDTVVLLRSGRLAETPAPDGLSAAPAAVHG